MSKRGDHPPRSWRNAHDPVGRRGRIGSPAGLGRTCEHVFVSAAGAPYAAFWRAIRDVRLGERCEEALRLRPRDHLLVVCIDQQPVHGTGIVWNHIPHGVEDETGDRPLMERARWLRHADFFIGLSSGLSWLAWSVGTPVVMISGFTHPTNEFTTPYRIINYHACNSCWNDPRHRFDHHDYLWCPRHANTPRQFECTRLITAEQVKQVIRTIPAFGATVRR